VGGGAVECVLRCDCCNDEEPWCSDTKASDPVHSAWYGRELVRGARMHLAATLFMLSFMCCIGNGGYEAYAQAILFSGAYPYYRRTWDQLRFKLFGPVHAMAQLQGDAARRMVSLSLDVLAVSVDTGWMHRKGQRRDAKHATTVAIDYATGAIIAFCHISKQGMPVFEVRAAPTFLFSPSSFF